MTAIPSPGRCVAVKSGRGLSRIGSARSAPTGRPRRARSLAGEVLWQVLLVGLAEVIERGLLRRLVAQGLLNVLQAVSTVLDNLAPLEGPYTKIRFVVVVNEPARFPPLIRIARSDLVEFGRNDDELPVDVRLVEARVVRHLVGIVLDLGQLVGSDPH